MPFPNNPKQTSASDLSRTRVYVEIGHGFYQFGPKTISLQTIYIWCLYPSRQIETYPSDLGIEVTFVRGLQERHYTPQAGIQAQRRHPSSGSRHAVRPSVSPGAYRMSSSRPPESPHVVRQEGFAFVSLERYHAESPDHHRVRTLHIRPVVQLPPTNPAIDPWLLELWFPNFPNSPRRLSPSKDSIL